MYGNRPINEIIMTLSDYRNYINTDQLTPDQRWTMLEAYADFLNQPFDPEKIPGILEGWTQHPEYKFYTYLDRTINFGCFHPVPP